MKDHWQIPEDLKSQFMDVITDPKQFDNFKRNPAIQMIIENTDYESGQECLDEIISKYLYCLLPMPISNVFYKEKIGNPLTLKYIYHLEDSHSIDISPTTLRYIMHTAQISEWMGSLDNLVIGEIGAGYGGLCTIIHEYFDPKRYVLFDIPEVMAFQIKYIKKFNHRIDVIEGGFKIIENEDIVSYNYELDLILAFCSWAELDKETKLYYLETVIKKAKMGVIAINYDFEENLKLISHAMPDKIIETPIPGFIVTFKPEINEGQ